MTVKLNHACNGVTKPEKKKQKNREEENTFKENKGK